MVRTRPPPLDFPCVDLGDLAVTQPSCNLRVAWQLGNERVLQLKDLDFKKDLKKDIWWTYQEWNNSTLKTSPSSLAPDCKHYEHNEGSECKCERKKHDWRNDMRKKYLYTRQRKTLICKQIWFCERLTWNSADYLVCDVSRQLNVLHQTPHVPVATIFEMSRHMIAIKTRFRNTRCPIRPCTACPGTGLFWLRQAILMGRRVPK
ncbi:hypothetical protein T265_12480, partial [Opisthorchis viverrini]